MRIVAVHTRAIADFLMGRLLGDNRAVMAAITKLLTSRPQLVFVVAAVRAVTDGALAVLSGRMLELSPRHEIKVAGEAKLLAFRLQLILVVGGVRAVAENAEPKIGGHMFILILGHEIPVAFETERLALFFK